MGEKRPSNFQEGLVTLDCRGVHDAPVLGLVELIGILMAGLPILTQHREY